MRDLTRGCSGLRAGSCQIAFALCARAAAAEPQGRQTTMRRISLVLFFVALANFFAFVIGCWVLGGDALAGKVEHGRYYVGNHGKYTEVTQREFAYSQAHAWSVFVTHPVGILSAFLAAAADRKRRQATA